MLLLGGLVSAYTALNAYNESNKPAPKPVTDAQQVAQVTASGLAPVTWTPTAAEKEAGYDKVVAQASSDFVSRLTSAPAAPFAASINPESHTVAAMLLNGNGDRTVYASVLLDSQIEELLPTLSSATSGLQVGGTAGSASKATSGSNSYAANMYNGASATTATATSPYQQAITGASTASSGTGSTGVPWLTYGVWFLLLAGMGFYLFRQRRRAQALMSGRGESPIGAKGKKKDDDSIDIPETRFSDVAGCDEAIEEMTELVAFLKEPERFTRVGVNPPQGALLVGPPGTGKTLLARAVAGEAGVPFYAVAGSDFVEMYVGVGAKRVRALFDKARKHPEGAIVFIDEIDAVGRARASGAATHSNTESENTLNALLVEMDGFAQSKVIVLGATNRDDILDAALTRPGRLDRKVQVPLPDRAGRERILEVHSKGKPISASVDLNLIARRTPGMSGAELSQLVNEACMTAAREGRDEVNEHDFDSAVAVIAMGKARTSAIVTPHDRLVTAWHEGGHTIAAMVLPDADPPVSVSIIPRGPAGGITWMAPGDDLFLTRRRAFARLVVAMAGRAAEEILLDGEFTSGPHGDLTAATQTALAMVTKYGMTDNGLMIRSEGMLSAGTRTTDDTIEAVEALLAEALVTARATLADHRDLLTAVVDGLLENDTLGHAALQAIEAGSSLRAPELPAAPREYRKDKPVVAVGQSERPVERVRFEDAGPRRRVLRLGPISITLTRRGRKAF